jgi:cell pole-organizing protein PopZ
MSAAKPLQDERHLSDALPYEPAMEDILASIRRIIADDQMILAEPGADSGSVGAAENFEVEAMPMADHAAPDGKYAHPAGAGPSSAPEDRAAPTLLSPKAEAPVAAAFNALVASRFAKNADAIGALTADALRPLIKAWLDENLPPLVERLVAAEIERITREG